MNLEQIRLFAKQTVSEYPQFGEAASRRTADLRTKSRFPMLFSDACGPCSQRIELRASLGCHFQWMAASQPVALYTPRSTFSVFRLAESITNDFLQAAAT
jgi:hypothetical protein